MKINLRDIDEINIESIKGKIFSEIYVVKGAGQSFIYPDDRFYCGFQEFGKQISDEIHFVNDTEHYVMLYEKDCCACCALTDIVGDFKDLINQPILKATCNIVCNKDDTDRFVRETATFYEVCSPKGCVSISWIGESNGYYREEARFYKIEHKEIKRLRNDI